MQTYSTLLSPQLLDEFSGYHCHPIVLWVPLPSYCADVNLAFSSVAHITQMVNYGCYLQINLKLLYRESDLLDVGLVVQK